MASHYPGDEYLKISEKNHSRDVKDFMLILSLGFGLHSEYSKPSIDIIITNPVLDVCVDGLISDVPLVGVWSILGMFFVP